MTMRRCGIVTMAGLVMAVSGLTAGCGNVRSPMEGNEGFTSTKLFKMQPAWRDPTFKIAGKADEFDDYRLAHPEMFGATEPPKGRNFRALLEWEESQILLLSYPDKDVGSAVTKSIAGIAAAALPFTKVMVLSKPTAAQAELVKQMKAIGVDQTTIDEKLTFLPWDVDSIWTIDFGPFPLVDSTGSIAFTDLIYYPERPYDDAIPWRLANELGITDYRGQVVFEGGNFQTDGLGRCYVTQGLYQENGLTDDELNARMRDFLGCQTMVVLRPLNGEGTTHIDMFFKLVSPTRVVLGQYTPEQDATNANLLDDNRDRLLAVDLGDGARLEVIRIPMPPSTPLSGTSEKVWRTYTNSTLVKSVNIWPVYTKWQDLQAEALSAWETALPDWTHVGINSDEIITWGGAMHCVTRTIPAGKLEKWIVDGTCTSDGVCDAPLNGYDSECTTNAQCVGPKRLCDCNDCSTQCVVRPDRCNGITYEGCCTAVETLKYCEDGVIQTRSCGGAATCGWDANNETYDCGFSGEGPTLYPRACPTGTVCGDVPDVGVCDDNMLKWCSDAVLKTRDCAAENLACGIDPADETRATCVTPCEDLCEEGVRACTETAEEFTECTRETNGCLAPVTASCEAGMMCQNGTCVLASAEDASAEEVGTTKGGGGCAAASSSVPASALPWLSLLVVCGIIRLRRTRQDRK